MSTSLLRARCRCKCFNPCGYGNCLSNARNLFYPGTQSMPNPKCDNGCLTPKRFYVRFEGLQIANGQCFGCFRPIPPQFPQTWMRTLCSGVKAAGLSFEGKAEFSGAYELTHYFRDTYWSHYLDETSWSGRVDINTTHREQYWGYDEQGNWVLFQQYGELTSQCLPGDYGGAGGCTGTGYLTPVGHDSSYTQGWGIKLDRTDAGWDLTLSARLFAAMPGVCGSEGVGLTAFRGSIADADHSSCYRPLVRR